VALTRCWRLCRRRRGCAALFFVTGKNRSEAETKWNWHMVSAVCVGVDVNVGVKSRSLCRGIYGIAIVLTAVRVWLCWWHCLCLRLCLCLPRYGPLASLPLPPFHLILPPLLCASMTYLQPTPVPLPPQPWQRKRRRQPRRPRQRICMCVTLQEQQQQKHNKGGDAWNTLTSP